jgi:hypothetical protein
VLSPDQVPEVAWLWAAVIRHQPVRRLAIHSLWRTLRALQCHGDAAQEVARSLLTALSRSLPTTEHEGFRATFTGVAKHGTGSDTFTDAVLDILGEVFGRSGDLIPGTGATPVPSTRRK